MSTANVNNSGSSRPNEDAKRRTENARWAQITVRIIDASKSVRVSTQESTRLECAKCLRAAASEINRIADVIERGEFQE
jgi:hypothetical protein